MPMNLLMNNLSQYQQTFHLDLHTHCLPGIDDGAKNPEVSLQLLSRLLEQGITKVVFTPHFYPHKETLSSLLRRRFESWNRLIPHLQGKKVPNLCVGAEIYLTRELSREDLRPLCLGKSNYLLIEMPRQPYHEWMAEEIQNIAFTWNVIPIIAHIERYLPWYSAKDYESLLAFDEQILQFNAESVLKKTDFKFIYKLYQVGYPLLISSDCHDLEMRRPVFDQAVQFLSKKKQGREILAALQNDNLVL
ncbi:CpsB/CapC family capsule biosynthesis tyrosine phosphatase [Scatolibacter rhodanostii]|uniref:CpsB/CapC family capsule biosynthesis tyrosine phosphatase n=1 Tax=Scatolibacter rhodanostii TaxID=2014781 RepID=UPI000C074C17|nr:CpsB/CapC family capsule biosynthesis tyrosine phosphatase [Scatolibacter rhodanostii]